MGAKYTEAQKRATQKYRREHAMRITVEINLIKDAAIVAWLSDKDNKAKAIKDALRPIIERECK